ncbi:alpha/beta hydrolase [Acinetobacter sp. Ac_5812]|uniref:alpha/beta fold hydrolase n=1 Tax=Acinetobacter sp. Ac_5812 TaxID=1848937 RepID=UPI0014904978|nr:alpha/beta hydrolase [Acinetobacter sp. Ac_5812]NNP70982.1 alpha/beta hydrolase [Acinetobacter sp. Ac_5812]
MNIVFLAGASGNTQFWNSLIAQLPHNYTKQVIAYPGFHGVATDPDIHSFNDLSNYVLAQIQQPSILIAQSMGGIFAIAAALQKSDLVKGLVLIATSGGINLDRFQVQDWRQFYQQAYIEYPDWFVTTKVDYEQNLPDVEIETLLIWGNQDPISPIEVGQYLNQILQKSELYIVEGGNHQLAEQCADEVGIQINDYLKKLERN